MRTKLAIGLGILVILILARSFFYIFLTSHLPRPQASHAAGTLILKDQLVFAGYETPEATLESMFWANVNGNYAAAIASLPKDQAVKEFGNNPAKFKAESQHGEFADFASLQIIARKNVDANTVELEFQELDKGDDSKESEPSIASVKKIGNEWKLDASASTDYTTNWDKGDNIMTFVQRTNSPSTSRTNSFTSKYKPDGGISIAKAHLADVGYGTPEDSFETKNWAYAHANYAKMLESYSLEIQAKSNADPLAREHFEAQMSKFGFPNERFHLLAKKVIANDQVELLVMTEQRNKNFTFAFDSVEQMVKVGDEWKSGGGKQYDAAWETGSQPEPTIQR
jgi:hypothetical protein